MALKKTLYQVLQVSRSANPEVIAAAYEARLRELGEGATPDLQSERTLRREAFEVLSDPARRALYDEKLRADAVRALASGGEPERIRPANAAASADAGASGHSVAWIAGIAVVGAIVIGGSWIYLEQKAKAEALRIVRERLEADQKLREAEAQKRHERADWAKGQYERNRQTQAQRREEALRERENARWRHEQARQEQQKRHEERRVESAQKREEYARRREEQENLRRSQQQLERDRRHLRELEQNRSMKF